MPSPLHGPALPRECRGALWGRDILKQKQRCEYLIVYTGSTRYCFWLGSSSSCSGFQKFASKTPHRKTCNRKLDGG